MKFWEPINDIAHDVARWVKGWGKKDAQAVDDEEEGWEDNPMFQNKSGNTGTEMNPLYEEEAEEDLNQRKMRSMDRKVLDRSAIENTKGYEKVKHSPSVKRLLERIDDYHDFMIRTKIPAMSGDVQKFMNELAEENGAVVSRMQEMLDYLVRKAEGYAKKTGRYREVMGICAQEAMKIRTQLDYVLKIQENSFYHLRTTGEVPYSGQSYEQVLVSKDLNIFRANTMSAKDEFARGGINVIYKAHDNERNSERLLKEGQVNMKIKDTLDAEAEVYERIKMEKPEAGESYTMNTAYRDVAVSLIDKLFNLNAVVDTSFARSEGGNQASLMDKAKGKILGKDYVYMDAKGEKQAKLLKQISENAPYLIKGLNGTINEEDKRRMEAAKKRELVNIGSDHFMESTMNLAALDIIVGHVDRHDGNMMMTEDGVKGIDNDSAFSLRDIFSDVEGETRKMSDADIKNQVCQTNDKGISVNVMNGQGQAMLPLNKAFPFVTRNLYDKIMNVSSSAVEGTLKGLITDDELKACIKRFKALQEHFGKFKDEQIVESFDDSKRDKYSSEIKHGFFADSYTNIMSQVRGSGRGEYFMDFDEDLGGYTALVSHAPELSAIKEYVKSVLGKKTLGDATTKVTYQLMKILEEKATDENFNLYECLKNGELDTYVNQAKQLAVTDKEKDDEQKKAKQAS